MSYLEAVLVANARRAGRAQRSALFRHRHITERPLGMLLWQLGAEPFTAAALAWGFGLNEINLVAPGEPRDRELTFRALTRAARAFNAWFESGERDDAPQVVVPNAGNLKLLGRLGRRLAYLPTTGDRPADPELVRFGKHLRFLAERARHPGQQLVIVLTDLLARHWVTGLSALENENLPALEAVIDPAPGTAGYEAVLDAERSEIGPVPTEADDDRVDKLLNAFNAGRTRTGPDGQRVRRTDEEIVEPLLGPIERHYRELVARGWPRIWSAIDRERSLAEAPSVARRWQEDVRALNGHLEWVVVKSGQYRTRDRNARAARVLHNWEEADRLLKAEEAIDDPLRMIPYVLSNQAVVGKVVRVEMEHYVQGPKKRVRRPRITLETDERCTIPKGKHLYWTGTPDKCEYALVDATPTSNGKAWLVTLEHQTSAKCERPEVGREAVFSVHSVKRDYFMLLPDVAPWTHGKAAADSSIEEPNNGGAWE